MNFAKRITASSVQAASEKDLSDITKLLVKHLGSFKKKAARGKPGAGELTWELPGDTKAWAILSWSGDDYEPAEFSAGSTVWDFDLSADNLTRFKANLKSRLKDAVYISKKRTGGIDEALQLLQKIR